MLVTMTIMDGGCEERVRFAVFGALKVGKMLVWLGGGRCAAPGCCRLGNG